MKRKPSKGKRPTREDRDWTMAKKAVKSFVSICPEASCEECNITLAWHAIRFDRRARSALSSPPDQVARLENLVKAAEDHYERDSACHRNRLADALAEWRKFAPKS